MPELTHAWEQETLQFMLNTRGRSLQQIPRPDSKFTDTYQFWGSDLIARTGSGFGQGGKLRPRPLMLVNDPGKSMMGQRRLKMKL